MKHLGVLVVVPEVPFHFGLEISDSIIIALDENGESADLVFNEVLEYGVGGHSDLLSGVEDDCPLFLLVFRGIPEHTHYLCIYT
jgi:hypothetical protein